MGAGRWVGILWLCACGATSTHSPPVTQTPCTTDTSVLYVAYQPPRVGERLVYREDTFYRFHLPQAEGAEEGHFVTEETVTSVEAGAIAELQVKFTDGRVHIPMSDASRPLSGRTFRFTFDNGKPAYWEGDAAAASEDELALHAYERNDVGRPHWLLRLLTDRTFKLGVTTYLPPESVRGSGRDEKTTDARITLRSIKGDLATFDVESRMTTSGFRQQMVVVLDTARARLASLKVAAAIQPSPQAKTSGFFLVVDVTQEYRYDSKAPVAAAPTCEPRQTLHVPWIPPRVGEQFSFEQKSVIELEIQPPGAAVRHIRGSWETATDERVVRVAEGVITALEAQVRKSLVRPVTVDGEPTELSNAGKKLEISFEPTKLTMKLDGNVVEPKTDFATGVLYRADVPLRYWATRLVTDRTFERGVEQHFTSELLLTLAPTPADVRVMLSSVENNVATFGIEVRVSIEAGPLIMPIYLSGQLELDTRRGRLVHLQLSGRYDTPDRMHMDSKLTLEQTFRYP